MSEVSALESVDGGDRDRHHRACGVHGTPAKAAEPPLSGWPPLRTAGQRAQTGGAMLALVLPLAAGWVKTSDYNALVELYEATNGAAWEPMEEAPEEFTDPTKGNEWWAVDDIYSNDPCPQNITHHWHGVACVDPCYYPIDGDDCRFGRITGLWLPFNGLEGTIPSNLFDKLVNLSIVDFSHNKLSGTIPTEVGKLRNIECANKPPPLPPCARRG